MPGAGVDASNISAILRASKARSIHSSAKSSYPSLMTYASLDLDGMNEPTFQTDAARASELVAALHALD